MNNIPHIVDTGASVMPKEKVEISLKITNENELCYGDLVYIIM